jgi:type IV secretion system protein VirB10
MTTHDPVAPLRRDNLSAFDAAPQVAVGASPWTLPLGVIGACALGLLVFFILNANRLRGADEGDALRGRSQAERIEPMPVPPMSAEPEWPGDPPEDLQDYAVEPELEFAPAPPAVSEAQARLNAPALVIDLSEPDTAAGPGGPSAQSVAGAIAGDVLSGNERFAARFGGGPTAQARPMANPSMTVPQGAIIAGVLETAINSDLPGYVRAIVSRDVLSFDGANVLAPRGSRLVGQYRASSELGQSRAFVMWTRLIRPDGVAVDLNSPGADALGRGGLEGETDRHFLRRFGGAILLTLLGGAANAAGDGDTVIVGVARGGSDAAATALGEEIGIPPTIHVAQGTPIRIFVTRDLDFSAVAGRTP